MAALDFPLSPSVGQVFVGGNGVAYQWNGSLWVSQGSTTSPGGDVSATSVYNGTPAGNVFVQYPFTTVLTGNTGSWLNTTTGAYTPPAGRYHFYVQLIHFSSSASMLLGLELRKNGVSVISSTGESSVASRGADVEAGITLDANGSDVFTVWGSCNVSPSGGGQHKFTAFPISGVKGPAGDLPNGFKLVDEQVLSVAGNALQVSFPLGAKLVRLEWHAKTTGLANGAIVLRGTVGGVVNTSAIYHSSQMVQGGATVSGQFLASQTGWAFHNAAAHTWGSATFLVPTLGTGVADYGIRNNAATRNRIADGLETNDSLTFDGFHLGIGTTTWVAGSYLRCFAIV